MSLCQMEVDHSTRAASLRHLFGTTEKLAEFLHQNYRAAAKAMVRMHHLKGWVRPDKMAFAHDHGWSDCYGDKKRYFLRRAEWLMTDRPHFNGRVPK